MRDIKFDLTLEEFVQFDKETEFVSKMGTGPDSLTIDRIDSRKGYEVGNIRAITYEDNVSKKLERMEFPYDPIAKAIWERTDGDKNWRAFRKQAEEVYDLVCRLQNYQTPNELKDKTGDDNCPF